VIIGTGWVCKILFIYVLFLYWNSEEGIEESEGEATAIEAIAIEAT
jgi:hypothetical protein